LTRTPLPIDPLLPEITATLAAERALVIEAPAGAGKTTRVPRALLDAGGGDGGEIWVLEPRRLPARLAAERVAAELGETVGETVGYTVRFDDVSSPRTRLRFVTEGLLTRRLLSDPQLAGVGTVVLDEFHERHVVTDLGLALLRRLQHGPRPDLRICAMSATLETGPLVAYLGDRTRPCPLVRSQGRLFDVAVEHLPAPDDRPLAVQVTAAVRSVLRDGPAGDVLVFLPGASEIRQAAEALAAAPGAAALLVTPLHGDMPLAEQARAVRPGDPSRRKVILSTNVAESSITIDGVVAVVDSGLARVATHSPWSGLPRLAIAKISQAAAAQRAGRAGRTRPGRALRLYTRHDFEQRRAHELPEIARADLAETLLALAGLGVTGDDAAAFPWLEAPPPAALAAAHELLAALGALEPSGGGALTALGRRMLRLPVHPRLARLVCEGEARGVGADACLAAALISERDIRRSNRASFGGARARPTTDAGEILDLMDLFREAERARFRPEALRGLEVDARAAESVDRARRQMAATLARAAPCPDAERDRALRLSVLAAFPDRVARARERPSRTVVLSAGGTAELAFERPSDWMVAVDVQEQAPGARAAGVTLRLAAAIEPDWLLEIAADRVAEVDELRWSDTTLRVERVSALRYGALALEESVQPAEPSAEASRLLADAALARGIERLPGGDAIPRLLARIAVAREAAPEAPLPALASGDLAALVRTACTGRTSLADLAAAGQAGIAGLVLDALSPEARRLLERLAPDKVTLPGGRAVTVNYDPGAPPWIASRLQDFFGARQGPAVGGGRIPLTVHLLAPNGRAVQVTRDLEGFWARHYPSIRRELHRRYPKHAWPDDGATASPPPPPARRR
jgi:ATP-dependent helicase HrpB